MPLHGIAPDKRQHQTIHLTGIRYCFVFNHNTRGDQSTSTSVPPFGLNVPVDVHFACVQLKGSPTTEVGWLTNANIQTYLQSNFFRRQDGNQAEGAEVDPDARTIPFTQYATGDPFDFNKSCLPLATEKMNILFHKKFPLFPRYNTGDSESKPWMRRHEGYIKINKSFSFYRSSDTIGRQPIVFLVWYNFLTRSDWYAPINVVNQYVSHDWRTKAYFRD